MTGEQSLALAKKYANGLLNGVELIQGKDCEIQSITEITGGHRVTFAYYGQDEDDTERTLKTKTLDVMDGVGIASVEKTDTSGKTDTYTITLTDGSTTTFTVKNADEAAFTEETNTQYSYQVGFQVGDGDKITSPNLKGNYFFEGTSISSTSESGTTVVIPNSKKYDFYLNTSTCNLYQRTDYNPSTETTTDNHWVIIATLKGDGGLNAFRTWQTIPGNEGKTIQQWVEETSGSSYEIQKVFGKPDITVSGTDKNVWYFYKTGKALGDKFVIRQFDTRNIDSLTTGNKYALKCVEGDDTTWVAFTVPSGLSPLESGWKYFVSVTLNHTTNVAIGTHKVDGELREMEVLDYIATDSSSTSACPTGYTELTTTAVEWSGDAWKWLSDPIPFSSIEAGKKYAFWTGVDWVSFDIVFLPTPTANSELVAMWDEKNLTGTMWGYAEDEDKYYLEYPSFLPITESSAIPEGAIDTSDWTEFEQMGTWCQTMYVQPAEESTVSEITIKTGESYEGLMSQSNFDTVIGTEALETEATTVKGAINELNAILRENVEDTFDTDADNAIEAINELESKKLNKNFTSSDENKVVKVVKVTGGAEDTYEARAVAPDTTISSESTDATVPTSKAVYDEVQEQINAISGSLVVDLLWSGAYDTNYTKYLNYRPDSDEVRRKFSDYKLILWQASMYDNVNDMYTSIFPAGLATTGKKFDVGFCSNVYMFIEVTGESSFKFRYRELTDVGSDSEKSIRCYGIK